MKEECDTCTVRKRKLKGLKQKEAECSEGIEIGNKREDSEGEIEGETEREDRLSKASQNDVASLSAREAKSSLLSFLTHLE